MMETPKYNFTRTKKIMFTNNKGGVGKTTLCFNIGVEIAKKGYKVLLVDLDPQCNLSINVLGVNYYENHENDNSTIYKIIENVHIGSGDINYEIKPKKVDGIYKDYNIDIIVGDLKLSMFESNLQTASLEASRGDRSGYFKTSAISRYIDKISLDHQYDIVLIDTGPSLGLLNNFIFLMSDYFLVPMMPDSFSVKGIQNLGSIFATWRRTWEITAKQLAKEYQIPSDLVVDGKKIFLGYIINSYKSRNKLPIKDQQRWLAEIPHKVKEFLSEKHCINGLVSLSYSKSIGQLKDVGKLTPLGQEKKKGFVDITSQEIGAKHHGTLQSKQQGKEEISTIVDELLYRLDKY